MIVQGIVVVALLVCAVQAVRAQRLLLSALWLAGTSALVALEMYLLGASEVAVIELSVGAGLVTVLFVFAINIAGEELTPVQAFVPKPLAFFLVLFSVALLIWMNAGLLGLEVQVRPESQAVFRSTLWESRVLDLMLQTVLIFTGVLGVLGLLAESQHSSAHKSDQLELADETPDQGAEALPYAAEQDDLKPVLNGAVRELEEQG